MLTYTVFVLLLCYEYSITVFDIAALYITSYLLHKNISCVFVGGLKVPQFVKFVTTTACSSF